MEIHTPKHPIHTFREFLKEVGIIVLGVLIALGAEQTVEALHWHERTALTQRELRDELALDVNSAAEWVQVSDCATARADTLYARLAAEHGTWSASPQEAVASPAPTAPDPMPPAFRLPVRPYASGTFEGARSSGALSHVSTDGMQEYDRLFGIASVLGRLQSERIAIVGQLQPLAVNQTLDGAERVGMEAELARLAGNFSFATSGSEQFVEYARQDGIPPDSAFLATTYRRLVALWGSCVVAPADVAARARQSVETSQVRPQPVPQL